MTANGPQTLRLRLPLTGVEAFVRAWAPKVEEGCLLLPLRKDWAAGTLVRFELLDAEGERLLLGEGKVAELAPARPGAGLLLRLTRMDASSKERWRQVLQLARAGAAPGEPEPEPEPEPQPESEPEPQPAPEPEPEPDEPFTDPSALPPELEEGPTDPGTRPDARLALRPQDEGEDEEEDEGATLVARPEELFGAASDDSTQVTAPPVRRSREVLLVGDTDRDTVVGRPSRQRRSEATDPEGEAMDARLELAGEGEDEDERTQSITSRQPTPAPRRKKKPKVPWYTESQEVALPEALEEGRDPTLTGVFAEEGDEDGPILGIDLGTCRVLAAIADERGVRCLPLDKAGRGLPAVVASGKGGQVLVGASALARRLEQPAETVSGSKRLLGRRFHAPVVQELAEGLPYQLVPDEGGGVAVALAAHTLSVIDINARILGAVKAGAELALGQGCSRAVVSVPAYFGDAGRSAVRQAGLEAGLEVLKIVSEPTAAALAFGYGQKIPGRRVLVYDLGGGTFDVSVLTISGDRFEVVGTGGDNFLGGLDFDLAIVRHLLEAMIRQGGPAEPEPATLERLLTEAEKLKIALSSARALPLEIHGLWQDDAGRSQDLVLEVRREELEGWVEHLIDRTVELTVQTLQEHRLSADQLDDLILVGAQSRMPLVRERLEARLGMEARDGGVDPEQAVALGCALVARNIQQAADPRAAKMELQDILGQNIGLGLPDGRIAPVIERGTRIPCKRTVRVATSEEGQASIELALFQGNVRYTADAEYLGTLAFVELPKRAAGEVQLVVVFDLDEEGLLTVTATEESTGQVISRVLSTVETPDEVEAALQRSSTEIRDLANLVLARERGEGQSTGIFRGIRKLFGGRK